MSGDRPGWDQAIEAAARAQFDAILARCDVDDPRVLWRELSPGEKSPYIEDAVIHLAAAYPVIVAAVRQHIAAEIDEARWADYENRYADQGAPDAVCTDHPTWACHAAGASTAWSGAARIARGES